MASFAGPNLINDSLMLSLDAANTNSYPGSGTTWFDMSDKGNNGTLQNGAAFDSGNKGSINLDGTNDRIDLGYSESLELGNGIISSEIWLYVDSLTTGFPLITKRGTGSSNNDRPYMLEIDSTGYVRWILRDNGSGITVCDTAVLIVAGNWYHLVGTHDNSNAKVYINGVEVKSVSSSISELETSSFNTPTRIGFRHTNTGTIYGDGKVAVARMYSKTLTSLEVRQNYNAYKGRFNL